MFWQSIPSEKLKWWILIAMTTSLSMVYIDVTVLPVTLPTLSRELNISALNLQWILNVYTLTLTVFAIAGGKLASVLGLKKAFCFGLALFAIASMLCGLSHSGWEMISARVLQGLGASIMIPSQQAILLETFPLRERGKAIGLLVSISSIFLAIGPFIGGSLTQYLSWRYIFWVNLPIAATGMLLTLFVVPHFKKQKTPFDWFGFFTLGIGVSAIMIGTMHIQSWGLKSPLTWGCLLLGIGMIAYLCRMERTHSHPLFDLSVIRIPSFIGGALTTFCNAFLLMVTVYWAIFFQDILLYSPAQAGALTCFCYAPVFFAAPLAGYLVDRYGPRLPITLGFGLLLVFLSLFNIIATNHILWMLLICLFFFGLSMPLIFTPSFVSLMHDIPTEKRGIASGMNSTLRQFSSTFGLAIFSTIFYQWLNWRFTHKLQSHAGTEHLNPLAFEGLLSENPSAVHALNAIPLNSAAFVQSDMIDSFISAFHAINLFALFCALAGLILGLRFLKNPTDANDTKGNK